jgi:Arc/MetJ-type ribon-helix-helix transcriptional regulator
MAMSKISVSLPTQLVDDLDYLASRTSVSRSALIGGLLAEAASEVRKILELVPPNPTPAEMLRMRGQSEEAIRSRLESIKGMTDDLFSSK